MWKKLDRDLTEADVGKKVRLRNGREVKIKDFYNNEKECVDLGGIGINLKDGINRCKLPSYDIVEIFEEDELETVPYSEELINHFAKRELVINLEEGTEVVKGRFQDSKGDTYYVTIERTE